MTLGPREVHFVAGKDHPRSSILSFNGVMSALFGVVHVPRYPEDLEATLTIREVGLVA